MTFYLSMVYGSNCAFDRERLWSDLQKLAPSTTWLVLGDFNVVRDPAEKLIPNPLILQEMMAFNSCLANCQLDDLNSTGCELTWTNKHDSSTRVWSKLDRALVNPSWLSSFPHSFAHFSESGISDHSPIIVHISEDRKIQNRFSFLNQWISHPDYLSTVADAWRTDKKGSPTFCFLVKQKSVKHALTKLHTKDFAYISAKVKFAKAALNDCQAQLLGHTQVSQAFQDYYHGFLGQSTQVLRLSDEHNLGNKLSADESLILAAPMVSKILENRFQQVLPSLVGVEQAAFVKGRSIFENVMLSQALMKGYTRQHISPKCLMKVDIRKAFDSLSWDFIGHYLHNFGFPQIFIDWILGCITNPWFSLKLNGKLTGYFQGKSGIRQGDPLSPYLFILGMEILSRALRKICNKPQVSYHPKCSSTNLTHFIFVDDLMFFIRGDVPSTTNVAEVLAQFAQVLGLTANPEKTTIYFGGVDSSIKDIILHNTGFSEGLFPFNYLGLPLNPSRITISMFDSLVVKIQKAVAHWSTHFLSYAGKLQLINSIIFGIENFWCSSLLLPHAVVQHLNKIRWNFFWGIPDGEMRMVFKSWDHLLNLAGSVQAAKLYLNAWTVNPKFSVQSAYGFYRNAPAADNWTTGLAHSNIVPSHKIICSLAVQHQLATVDNLQRRGIPYANRCALCLAQEETHAHLFFTCPVSSAIWQQLLLWLRISRVISSLQKELDSIGSSRHWHTDWLTTTLAATVHQLCVERNKRIFQGIDQPISCIVKHIKYLVAVRMFKWSQHECFPMICASLCS
ncbi:uncharacterized protein LOC141631403 [Silene latifolia]|uniref:uncharacterized protein LOC141631403 n=1 Tax=Silene latifolia TaxID=37657 RepID=UPI003D76EFDA